MNAPGMTVQIVLFCRIWVVSSRSTVQGPLPRQWGKHNRFDLSDGFGQVTRIPSRIIASPGIISSIGPVFWTRVSRVFWLAVSALRYCRLKKLGNCSDSGSSFSGYAYPFTRTNKDCDP